MVTESTVRQQPNPIRPLLAEIPANGLASQEQLRILDALSMGLGIGSKKRTLLARYERKIDGDAFSMRKIHPTVLILKEVQVKEGTVEPNTVDPERPQYAFYVSDSTQQALRVQDGRVIVAGLDPDISADYIQALTFFSKQQFKGDKRKQAQAYAEQALIALANKQQASTTLVA